MIWWHYTSDSILFMPFNVNKADQQMPRKRKVFHYGKPFKRRISKEHYADILRHNMTPAEARLWKLLVKKACEWGVSFEAQKVVCGYIPDFFCGSLLLAVEVDGGVHRRPDVKANDRRRTRVLNSAGITVIRFTNTQCLKHTEKVCNAIWRTIQDLRRR